MKTGQAILYIPDLAELLGRTEAAIRSAHQREQLPKAFTLLGRTAWHRADIDAWLADQSVQTNTARPPKRGRKREGYDIEPTPAYQLDARH